MTDNLNIARGGCGSIERKVHDHRPILAVWAGADLSSVQKLLGRPFAVTACAGITLILAGAVGSQVIGRSTVRTARVGAASLRTPEQFLAAGGESAKIPAWIPLYPGAVVEKAVGLEHSGRRNGMCYLHTAASWDRVSAFYSRELRKRGYHAQFRAESANPATLTASDGRRAFRMSGSGGGRLSLYFSEVR